MQYEHYNLTAHPGLARAAELNQTILPLPHQPPAYSFPTYPKRTYSLLPAPTLRTFMHLKLLALAQQMATQGGRFPDHAGVCLEGGRGRSGSPLALPMKQWLEGPE